MPLPRGQVSLPRREGPLYAQVFTSALPYVIPVSKAPLVVFSEVVFVNSLCKGGFSLKWFFRSCWEGYISSCPLSLLYPAALRTSTGTTRSSLQARTSEGPRMRAPEGSIPHRRKKSLRRLHFFSLLSSDMLGGVERWSRGRRGSTASLPNSINVRYYSSQRETFHI